MMSNVTYKRLNEVCINQSSNIAINKITDNHGDYPLYGASGLVKEIDFYHQETPYIAIIKDGAGVGRVGRYPAKSSVVGTMQYILPNEKDCILDYIYYCLLSMDLGRSVTGATIPHIYFKDYGKNLIPVPSLEDQQRIVRELDAIHAILAAKNEQLRELDSLAQAVFYDMFGDPITNEKGWMIKKLGEVCDVRDGTHDSPHYLQHSDYLLITSKNIVDGRIDFSTATNYISKEDFDAINKRSKVDVGDIIMPMIGTIGNPIIVGETEQKYCIKNVALIKFGGNNEVLNIYVKMLIDSPSYMQYMLGLNKGGTQKFIALGTIRQLSLPLPPLDLQQAFASKITAIEQQKERIRLSLRETEALLAARMQHYFD